MRIHQLNVHSTNDNMELAQMKVEFKTVYINMNDAFAEMPRHLPTSTFIESDYIVITPKQQSHPRITTDIWNTLTHRHTIMALL